MDTTNTDEQIATALTGPAQATSDGLTVIDRSVNELIDADRYLRNKAALNGTNANGGRRSAWGKLRMAQVVPPGTV